MFAINTYIDKLLFTLPLFSTRKRTVFHPLHTVSGDARQATPWTSIQASGVDHIATSHIAAEVMHNTPPLVHIFEYIDISRSLWARVVGKRRRETPDRPIVGEEQKKEEKRPKPGKPKPEKPGPEKTRREGDKGSQRVKRPKNRIYTV
ncbi:MAG: hypothetical protein M3Y81_29055 [Chloroflexota bacterium]|nr:hypothetical protein [Chloroflexota bacterium]